MSFKNTFCLCSVTLCERGINFSHLRSISKIPKLTGTDSVLVVYNKIKPHGQKSHDIHKEEDVPRFKICTTTLYKEIYNYKTSPFSQIKSQMKSTLLVYSLIKKYPQVEEESHSEPG